MNNFKFNCPQCGKVLEAPVDKLGHIVGCPACQSSIQLPDEMPKPPPPPPPKPEPAPPPARKEPQQHKAPSAPTPRPPHPDKKQPEPAKPAADKPSPVAGQRENLCIDAKDVRVGRGIDAHAAIRALAEHLAREFPLGYDVEIAAKSPGTDPSVSVHILTLDSGNRGLRRLIPALADKDLLAVEGAVRTHGDPRSFTCRGNARAVAAHIGKLIRETLK